MKMHPSHRPCLLALPALPARSRTIDLRGNVTHTGNLGSVPSRWLGGSVVRWLGSCANPQPETRTSSPENEGLVPKAPIPKCRIIHKERANIMQIACAVAGSVPKFSCGSDPSGQSPDFMDKEEDINNFMEGLGK